LKSYVVGGGTLKDGVVTEKKDSRDRGKKGKKGNLNEGRLKGKI